MSRVFAPLKHLDERLRHALWAIGLAALGLLMSLFDPIDQQSWMAQTRLVSEDASGQIVLAASDVDFTDPNRPELRTQLARELERLDAAGARRIFIDAIFQPSADPAADRHLNATLHKLGERVFLAKRSYMNYDRQRTFRQSAAVVAQGVPQVATEYEARYLGIDWDMPFALRDGEKMLPSLPAALAERSAIEDSAFIVDYSFRISSIPVISILKIDNATVNRSDVAGRDVVIALQPMAGVLLTSTPRTADVPHSIIQIVAAETLLAGYEDEFPALGGFVICCVLLVASILIGKKFGNSARRTAYATVVTIMVASIVATYFIHVRTYPSPILATLTLYAAARLRIHWQRRYALVDQATGLPTFRAFERTLQEAGAANPLVAARVHGASHLMKALSAEDFAEFTNRLVDRLRVSDTGPTIYSSDGRYLAWEAQESEIEQISAHLEGLRAVCASPIIVGQTELDVAITFGVSHAPDRSASARIAAAVATVERTSTSSAPIEFDQDGADRDDLWDLSLQSRIDAALANDEINLVYQPKMTIDRTAIVGIEGLVRWYDPERGEIPPSHFIEQCEVAGRITHLTRFTLDRAMRDATLLAARGLMIPVSVNISATLLRDERVVIMVADAIQRMRFPPELLCLEVTETARIADLDRAHGVLVSLKGLGVKLSLDDFGVGAANIEVLASLPFDEIKIDRSFVAQMHTLKGRAIVDSMIRLGALAGIVVVAEGVESDETLAQLALMSCPVVQGYGVYLPSKIERLMVEHGFAMKSVSNMV
ncbi:GGDEF domain-containing phosphodiesterase [Qipengyuania sp. YIM B01966]|uniref:GGDEF domain-containing phosphodiesterase n=1 Tax=Qipengyuania sp. YIM B01966 TaxID=2778646 RepID=UPI0018F79E6E|nr:EAL domain-containing protein [Qipengyuania sp. YIM B01966]